MRAKTINEVQNFERGIDPKNAMDIGMTPKRIVQQFSDSLKKFGIENTAMKSHNYNNDIFDINFPEGPYPFISYASDKAAQEEWGTEDEPQKGGFVIYNKSGDDVLFGPSHDMAKIIKKIVVAKYGSLEKIKEKIQKLQISLNQLEELKNLMSKL